MGIVGLGGDDLAEGVDRLAGAGELEEDGAGHDVGLDVVGVDGDDSASLGEGLVLLACVEAGLDAFEGDGVGLVGARVGRRGVGGVRALIGLGRIRIGRPLRPGERAGQEQGANDEERPHGLGSASWDQL